MKKEKLIKGPCLHSITINEKKDNEINGKKEKYIYEHYFIKNVISFDEIEQSERLYLWIEYDFYTDSIFIHIDDIKRDPKESENGILKKCIDLKTRRSTFIINNEMPKWR
jgi:hypothetical protein